MVVVGQDIHGLTCTFRNGNYISVPDSGSARIQLSSPNRRTSSSSVANRAAWCSRMAAPIAAVAARGVPQGTRRVQILRFPAEPDTTFGGQQRHLVLPRQPGAAEVGGMLHPYQIGAEVQHQAGLHQSAVNAVALLIPGQHDPGRQAELAGQATDREHGVGAQAAADDLDHLRLPAVTVQDHQSPHAGPNARCARSRSARRSSFQPTGSACRGSAHAPPTGQRTASATPAPSHPAAASSSARARIAALIVASTLTGRCGPCCSIAATGRMATVSSGSDRKSVQVRSCQCRNTVMS